MLKKIQTQGKLNDGKTLAYAWGLEIGTYRGLPIVEHGGSLGGYRAHIMRMPSQHTSVALLCNAGSIVPATLARRVADVVLADKFTVPPQSTVPAWSGREHPLPTARRWHGACESGVRRRLLQRRSAGALHDLSQRQ